MGAIYRREMGAFFSSAVAYVFLAVFYALSGLFFCNSSIGVSSPDMSGSFSSMLLIVIILIPVLTMRLFSEEKKQKTEQGLLTAPVSLGSIVCGKFFAAFTLFVIASSIFPVYGLIIEYFGSAAWATIISNYVALLLLGAAYIAICLFISSLTENQIVSAVASFIILMLMYLIDYIASIVPEKLSFVQKILSGISFNSRYYEFTMGIFNLSSVLFFISVIVLFNFFTVRIFEKRRWS